MHCVALGQLTLPIVRGSTNWAILGLTHPQNSPGSNMATGWFTAEQNPKISF